MVSKNCFSWYLVFVYYEELLNVHVTGNELVWEFILFWFYCSLLKEEVTRRKYKKEEREEEEEEEEEEKQKMEKNYKTFCVMFQ